MKIYFAGEVWGGGREQRWLALTNRRLLSYFYAKEEGPAASISWKVIKKKILEFIGKS